MRLRFWALPWFGPFPARIAPPRRTTPGGPLLECREDEGCRAAFDLTPEILEEMKMGGEMSVAIVDGRTRRAISFNFSLIGFTKAYDEFSAKM